MTQSLKEKIEESISEAIRRSAGGFFSAKALPEQTEAILSLLSSELDRVLKGVRLDIELKLKGETKKAKRWTVQSAWRTATSQALSAFDRSVEELRK